MPAILLHSTYPLNERFSLSSLTAYAPQVRTRLSEMRAAIAGQNVALAEVCNRYRVAPIDCVGLAKSLESLNVVFLPRAFQPAGDTFDRRYLFVGPSIGRRYAAETFPFERLDAERPLLYVAFGSIFSNQPAFFKQCFKAFGGQPWQVVLSYGRFLDPAELGPIPANFLLAAHVPQLEILPRARVFVTHGGPNSAMESLYFGVPMVTIPQQLTDQTVTARRIADLGLGIALAKEDVTVAALRAAVERAAGDAAIRRNVRDMRQVVRDAGGYLRAADAIEDFARGRSRRLS